MRNLVTAMLVAAVVQAGCNNATSFSTLLATNSVVVVDEADAVAWEGGFLWAAALPVDPTLAVDVTATAASGVDTITILFTPAGCATATASSNMITLQLAGCSGPFGINAATGTVTLTFNNVMMGGVTSVQLVANATNLQIGGGVLTIAATAVLSENGNHVARTLTVSTNGDGFGPNGVLVARQGQYTIAWNVGQPCAAINGMLAVGSGNSQRMTFRALMVCTAGCPQSGVVTLTDPAISSTFSANYGGGTTVLVTVTSTVHTQHLETITCG